jgi:hypothetical protein
MLSECQQNGDYAKAAMAKGECYSSESLFTDPTFIDYYKKGSYTLGAGQAVFGEPIYFSFTIPTTVKKDQGLNPIKPVLEGDIAKVPSSIRSIVVDDKNSTVLLSQGYSIN